MKSIRISILSKIEKKILLVLVFFFSNAVAETLPSFPSATSVDTKKQPTSLSPIENNPNNKTLMDTQALNAMKTLIQGGIPINQSSTQSVEAISPISQYSGTPMNRKNIMINYLIKKGDTLDNIIRASLSSTPFNLKKVRKQIIASNKHAFPTGRPTSMQAGALITIPSLSQMKMMLSGGNIVNQNQTMQVNKSVTKDPHAGWVRFP
jgi:hypothetical protein